MENTDNESAPISSPDDFLDAYELDLIPVSDKSSPEVLSENET
jgi:hypothetical protein